MSTSGWPTLLFELETQKRDRIANDFFSATVEEVKQHFKECGEVVRVTIGKNKFTQKPLGYCYIEFKTKEAATRSKILNESLFKGR